MEYIQTVLLQIEATRLEQASQSGGLLAELDEHRNFLRQQPGFRDLRITRSINPEGNVLVVVETRWTDDESLVRYETGEPNVAGIVNQHRNVIVSDSVQVLDMEALRTDMSWRPLEQAAEARGRLMLPLIVPFGVLAFVLLVIYGLSRVYLELGGSSAVGLAAGIAIGILAVAFYLANNPRAPSWQIAGIFVVAGLVLFGGAIWAVSEKDKGEAVEQPGGASPSGSPGAAAANTITLGDNFFDYGGAKSPTIPVTAGQQVTFTIENKGNGSHNMHVAPSDANFTATICSPGGDAPCSDPPLITAGKTATISFKLDTPGTYNFRCDYHATEMTGQIQVK